MILYVERSSLYDVFSNDVVLYLLHAGYAFFYNVNNY